MLAAAGEVEARVARTRVKMSSATKQDTESCGQPKGHKPTGSQGERRRGRVAGAGGGTPLARRGTPPTTSVTPPPRRRRRRCTPATTYDLLLNNYQNTSNFHTDDLHF